LRHPPMTNLFDRDIRFQPIQDLQKISLSGIQTRNTLMSGNTLVVGAPRESSNATGVNGDQATIAPVTPVRLTFSFGAGPIGLSRPISKHRTGISATNSEIK